ncbi:MAG TPA: glycoside hydrolase family 127 protein, partial [Niabella sp.]|nr:glycoside hydrolase family 127 protein [Niabella sp.]
VVYCLESNDLPGKDIFNMVLPVNTVFKPVPEKIDNGNVMALTGEARMINTESWKNVLYRPINDNLQPVQVKLIPYFAWANRGQSDMSVWMPLIR